MTDTSVDGESGDDLAPVVELRTDDDIADTGARDADAFLATLGPALPQPAMALRAAIATIGAAQMVLVAPWLVDRDPLGLLGDSSPAHLARDGALGLVVAVAALLVAWRPRWALPCFAITSVTLVAQTVAGFVDSDAMDNTGVELVHIPSIVLTALIALCAIRLPSLGPRR